MRLTKIFIALALLMSSIPAWAQMVDGLIIASGDEEHKFVIADVSEVTFADDGLTVIKTDDASISFTGEWQLRFGEVEAASVLIVGEDADDSITEVYDLDGRLVFVSDKLSGLNLRDLPAGVYVVKCNGKSFKIKR